MRQLRSVVLPGVLVAAGALLSSCGDSGEKAAIVRTYNMGERATMGHIVYTVFETQWLTHIGEGAEARVPQNRFFLVRMSVVNSLGTDVIVPNFRIEDDGGNTYPELSSGEGVPQYIGFLRSVRPADTATGNALFDAPPRHYKLRISDETGDMTGYIDIPLNFTSQSTDVPVAVQSEKKK